MFKNKERELRKRELEIYRQERLLSIDREVENYRITTNEKVVRIARLSQEELADYEHEYHKTKEVKGIELAKLEAKIEHIKEVNELNKKIIEQKDNEIKRLSQTIDTLISKIPTTIVQQKTK